MALRNGGLYFIKWLRPLLQPINSLIRQQNSLLLLTGNFPPSH